MRCILSIFVLTALAGAAMAEKQPFERYRSIVDRQMFGPLPEGFDPTKPPNEVQKSASAEEKMLSKEQEKLQSSIHFSMINLTPDGKTAVGFTDNSDPKNPVNYYLKVGETRNGWTVKEADAQAATMTIVRGEIEVTLSIGGNSANGAGTILRAGAVGAPAGTSPNTGRRLLGGGGLGGLGTLRARREERRKARAEEEAKQAADAAAKEEERKAKEAEREAQAEQEKQQREQERAEQRQQLLAIQEELKRVREAKQADEKKDNADGSEENQD